MPHWRDAASIDRSCVPDEPPVCRTTWTCVVHSGLEISLHSRADRKSTQGAWRAAAGFASRVQMPADCQSRNSFGTTCRQHKFVTEISVPFAGRADFGHLVGSRQERACAGSSDYFGVYPDTITVSMGDPRFRMVAAGILLPMCPGCQGIRDTPDKFRSRLVPVQMAVGNRRITQRQGQHSSSAPVGLSRSLSHQNPGCRLP